MSLTMTGIWMNRLLAEMNVEKEPFNPVTPYEDSQLGFLFHSSMDAASTLIEGNISSEMRLKRNHPSELLQNRRHGGGHDDQSTLS